MIRLLEAAAAAAPDRQAVVTSEEVATYGDLLADARRVAAGLRRRGVDRFAVVERDAAWVVRLLAGAALVGADPCQYQADIGAGELADQAAALGHKLVVSRRTDVAGPFDVIGPEALLADGDPGDDPSGPAAPDLAPGDGPQPLTIRTTGTTGVPKAACHDWRTLAGTVAAVRPAPEQRWLLAYGPHQFAGIQVLLHVMACQGTLVAPFPRQPRDGLEALCAGQVTCVSATPTYWRFLLAEARSRRAELPALTQVTLGGEAAPADLLDELRRTFPGARLSQVYASTELGSITSVRDGRPGLATSALWSADNPDANLKVVDGQLWVRPTSAMSGYAGDAAPGDPTGADGTGDPTDGAPGDPTGADGTGDGAWRPTGDLVEVVGDRVLFRGRQSEVINVGGVKVHPLPVEQRIAALGEVAAARVFGRPNPLTGAIVAVEVVPADGADPDAVRQAIKLAVADLPRPWQPRSVTFVDDIETRGGKTVRGVSA